MEVGELYDVAAVSAGAHPRQLSAIVILAGVVVAGMLVGLVGLQLSATARCVR